MATTTAPARKPTARKKPVAKEVIPTESPEPEEDLWASGNDLPSEPFVDAKLPIMGKMVRIRFLSNAEATGLGVLPDLARFSQLIAASVIDTEEPRTDEAQQRQMVELIAEKSHYMELVAHLCVMDLDGGEGTDCCNAAIDIAPHPKSLWTRDQVTMLEGADLQFITNVAERTVILESVRPLSQGLTESDTEPPANTGE